jgi:putative DNA primase/helicase
MTTLAQAAEQMLAAGMPNFPDGGLPIADGRIHRYGKKKRAWYRLRELPRRNGGTFIAGHFGIWGQLDRTKIVADFSGIDEEERERLRASWADKERLERLKREQKAKSAGQRAVSQWKAARSTLPDGVRCPYLERKSIAHENGAFRYFVENELATLVVPMVRYDVQAVAGVVGEEAERQAERRLVGLQKILPDGTKRFNKGTDPVGAACLLGKPPKDGAPILFVEGVATGGSVRMAVERGYPVVVAFTAGNLAHVARIYRALYPKSPFLFCADDDAYLEAQLNNRLRGDFDAAPFDLYQVKQGGRYVGQLADKTRNQVDSAPTIYVEAQLVEDELGVQGLAGYIQRLPDERRHPIGISNAGRTKANQAAAEVGNAWVCYPRFKSVVVNMHGQRELDPNPDAPRLTDFNDLHKAEGLEVVRNQLLEAIALITVPAKADAAAKEKERQRREEDRKRRDKEKADEDDRFKKRLADLVGRYVLIYPSDEAWDRHTEEIVKLDHVGRLYGRPYVAAYCQTQRKDVVHARDVVFDPSGPIDQLEDARINLFRGLELKPDSAGECHRLKGLLFYLCGDDQAVYDWVLKWLAYPLQHLGAKMSTAIVMHGEEEGTGKNLFFSAIAEIYGRHGGFITQRQLESSFNTWQSAKLFMVANEVVTRAEMRHQSGYVRHLITEPNIWINPKMVNERQEANHMNLAFLSNENQALLVPRFDRRFVVIRTPGKLEKARYLEVVDELAKGGAAALYAELLELDLGDFHTHSDPIFTQAKADMIELGLASPQLFWQDFHDGEFPLPYQPCLREDLYRAYLLWCSKYGEKMPKRINQFIPEFKSMNGVRFDRRRLSVDGKPRQRRICIMGEKPGDILSEDEWISSSVGDFNEKLQDMQRGGER